MGLKVGDKAPEFTLNNTNGDEVSLRELIGNGNKDLLLLFFPLAFSGACTEELCTVRDNMKFYDAVDASVAAIGVDSFFTLKEFRRSNNLKFPVLSDFNKEVAKSYDALYDDYYGLKGVAKRAAFIIGKDGIIKYAEVLEDSDKQPDFKAIQNVLSHG